MTLERSLQQLGEEATALSYSVLARLSDLTPEEVQQFVAVWKGVGPARRHNVVSRLVELAEDNAELDYTSVFKTCLEDDHDAVRESAVNGLWEFEDRSMITCFSKLIINDKSPGVRTAAAVGLGKFARLFQDGKLLSRDGDRIRDVLEKVLQNTSETWDVRRRALEAVAVFNSPRIKEFITWAYASNELKLKCSAIYAMGRTGEASWLPTVVKELESASPALRFEAANALGEMAEEESAPHLLPLLQDDDQQVVLATVRALGEVGGPIARRALRRLLTSGDEALQEAAQEALDNIETADDPLSFRYGM